MGINQKSQGALTMADEASASPSSSDRDPIDREILALRHFEHLSNGEAAAVLGLDKSAASKRYARALVRLKDILANMPGGLGEL